MQLDDGLGLALGEFEFGNQRVASLARALGDTDEFDEAIEVVEGLFETDEDVFAIAGFAQEEVRAAAHNFFAVLDEELEDFEQFQFAWLTIDDGEHDGTEVGLHLRELVELVENDFVVFAALEFENDTHAVAITFVADVGDAVDFLFVDEGGDVGDELRLVHLIGDLGDDDALAVFAEFFGEGLGAHLDGAAATGVAIDNTGAAEDKATGGEVRAGDDGEHLGEGHPGVFDDGDEAVDDLGKVVWRDVGGHADGDATGAIDQEIGDDGGEELGLHFGVVEVGLEIDRFFVDILHHGAGDFGEARFGVTHGGGRVSVDGAEIALTVDERVAEGEGLRHADQGVVDGAFAMGVIFTEHVTADASAFAGGAIPLEAHFAHGK